MKKVYFKNLNFLPLFFISILLFFPTISVAQLTQQDLQIEKLQKEIKLLDNQIKKSEFDWFNMLTSLIPIFTGIGVAALTAFFTLKNDRKRQRLEHQNNLELQYDIKLREIRIPAYKELWKKTNIELNGKSTKTDLYNLLENLRDWYFKDGNGMLLTEYSQKLYHNLKRRIKTNHEQWNTFDEKMKEDKIKNMEDFISGLRTSLSRDIGGRENQLISSKYGDLRISSPSGWIIKVDNTTKQQEFKVKYQGAETIKIPNGKISMKITNLEKWDTIGAKEENKSNMNNNEEVIFVWNYSKNLDEIFKKIDDDTKSEISLDSIYILVQVTIGNRSVVQSFELKNEGL